MLFPSRIIGFLTYASGKCSILYWTNDLESLTGLPAVYVFLQLGFEMPREGCNEQKRDHRTPTRSDLPPRAFINATRYLGAPDAGRMGGTV